MLTSAAFWDLANHRESFVILFAVQEKALLFHETPARISALSVWRIFPNFFAHIVLMSHITNSAMSALFPSFIDHSMLSNDLKIRLQQSSHLNTVSVAVIGRMHFQHTKYIADRFTENDIGGERSLL
jgi:hypothetical protein